MPHGSPYNVFLLPDLEAYVHGMKFQSKLKRWSKSQGFTELSPENLKEWCTDSFVLDSLLKVNKYRTSPLTSPISPMTPDVQNMWNVPPCRGNLLDGYKQSVNFSAMDVLDTDKPTKIKRFWHRMTRHKKDNSRDNKSRESTIHLTPLTTSLPLHPGNSRGYCSSKSLHNDRYQGSTNVLKLLELI